jgi:hypothetical protein
VESNGRYPVLGQAKWCGQAFWYDRNAGASGRDCVRHVGSAAATIQGNHDGCTAKEGLKRDGGGH